MSPLTPILTPDHDRLRRVYGPEAVDRMVALLGELHDLAMAEGDIGEIERIKQTPLEAFLKNAA